MKKYYRLLADPVEATRWHLKAPVDKGLNEVDARSFTHSVRYLGDMSLRISLRRQGHVVDFNFGDFGMVVTPKEVNAEIELMQGVQVQRIPVNVESCDRDFEILNVLDVVSCIRRPPDLSST